MYCISRRAHSHRIFRMASLPLVIALTACAAPQSGGGTVAKPAAGTVNPNPPTYATLSTTNTNNTLIGDSYGFTRVTTGGTTQITSALNPVSGQFAASTQSLSLTDGPFTLTASNGTTVSTTFTDANGNTLTVVPSKGNSYVFSVPYSMVATLPGGAQYFSFGTFGIGTGSQDMPVAGNASYTGSFKGIIVPNGSTSTSIDVSGTSRIDASFGASTVSVQLTVSTMASGGATIPLLFTKLDGTGLQIQGNRFSGGTWGATDATGQAVAVAGNNVTTSARGTFYGYNANISAPAEVGGVTRMSGSTADVLVRYNAK